MPDRLFSRRLDFTTQPDVFSKVTFLAAAKFAHGENIRPEGTRPFEAVLRNIARLRPGEQIALSDAFGVMGGYTKIAPGVEKLSPLKVSGALHVYHIPEEPGPLGYIWPQILLSDQVKRATGEELTHIQREVPFYDGYNAVLVAMYKVLQYRSGGIIFGDSKRGIKPAYDVLKAIARQELLAFPVNERPSELPTNLSPVASRLITFAAERGVPIVAVGVWKKDDTLGMNSSIIEPDEIMDAMRSPVLEGAGKLMKGLVAADVVRRRIKEQLP